MAGLNAIMDNSLSALFAAQAGLATTGHNISNANTPGYSRQDVLYAAKRPQIMPYGAIGRGVEIQGIRRIQDEFLLNNLRVQNSRLSSFAAVDNTLYEVETMLGSLDNDHLGSAMTNFFSAWNDLSQPPISDTNKQLVVSTAVSLVNDFHSLHDALNNVQGNIEKNIEMEIQELNRLLGEVGHMNSQIMAAESNGQPANDLRDQRDYLITQVSTIAEISVLERDDGSKDVILAGRTMVARGSVTLFDTVYESTEGGLQMMLITEDTRQPVKLSPGRLEGLFTSRDVHLKNVRDHLDQVAQRIINEVNHLHVQGRTGTSSGLAFFTGDSMHTIGVNEAILSSGGELVATGRTDAESDNTIALEIANLANVSIGGQGERTVTDDYRSLLVDVASNRRSFEFMVENQMNVVATLETKMASISGVSLDEEGANMVRYQNSYNAAAKVISTVQEMYDALLNMI